MLKNSLGVYTLKKAMTAHLTDVNVQDAFRGCGKNWVSLKSSGNTLDGIPKSTTRPAFLKFPLVKI